MTKWYIGLLCLLIFFIPSNLFYKFDISHAYVHGLLVDYLIPKLYLSDLPIIGLLLLWLKDLQNRKKLRDIKNPVVLLFSLLVVAFFSRQLVSTVPRASLWFFLKLVEMAGLTIFLISHHALLKKKIIWFVLAFTLGFQALLGIVQFYTQSSIFHTYLALGEVNFDHTIGLAKDSYFHTENILAYGTTAHPNILGGFLVLGGLLILDRYLSLKLSLNKNQVVGLVLFFGLLLWALCLTQSISAAVALGVGLLFCLFRNKMHHPLFQNHRQNVVAVVTFFLISGIAVIPYFIHQGGQKFPDNLSFTRRDSLDQAAALMIKDNPILGTGLNNFTTQVEEYLPSREPVRFVQPAHNVLVLWLAETGLIGLLVIGMSYYMVQRKILKSWPTKSSLIIPIIVLFPLLTIDHYLLTQQTGMLMSIFFLMLFQLDQDSQPN